MTRDDAAEFVEALAGLLDRYKGVHFEYTTDDDGVHIRFDPKLLRTDEATPATGIDIMIGWHADTAALRKAAASIRTTTENAYAAQAEHWRITSA